MTEPRILPAPPAPENEGAELVKPEPVEDESAQNADDDADDSVRVSVPVSEDLSVEVESDLQTGALVGIKGRF